MDSQEFEYVQILVQNVIIDLSVCTICVAFTCHSLGLELNIPFFLNFK